MTIANCLAVHEALQPITTRFVPTPACEVVENVVKVNADHLEDSVRQIAKHGLPEMEALLAQPKIAALERQINPTQKTVVFTSAIKGVVEPAAAALRRAGLSVFIHTGEEKTVDVAGQQINTADLFIRDPAAQVLIASTGTLATGFDGLQKVANRMIFLTLPWTAADMEQAKARMVRQGTKFQQVEITTLSAVLNDSETGDEWGLDPQKLEIVNTKRSACDCVADGVIPEAAALKLSRDSVMRGLKKWQRRCAKQEAQAA